MIRKVVFIGFGLSCLLWAESVEFPAGGVLKFERANGDLRIEGWDRSNLEFTTPVTTERHGDEVVVTPKSSTAPHVYVPRNARLVIHHRDGEVLIEDVRGDINVTVRRGAIGLFLPEGTPYDIDARAKLGGVASDFATLAPRWRWFFGHQFAQPGSTGARKLYLRVGYGDISILKTPQTEPRP